MVIDAKIDVTHDEVSFPNFEKSEVMKSDSWWVSRHQTEGFPSLQTTAKTLEIVATNDVLNFITRISCLTDLCSWSRSHTYCRAELLSEIIEAFRAFRRSLEPLALAIPVSRVSLEGL